MMSLLEYSTDVNKNIEEIFKLCDKIGIEYSDENSMLDEDGIILLDNEIQDMEDYIVEDKEELEERLEERLIEEEAYDLAMDLATNSHIDMDSHKTFEKVKSKVAKRSEAKKDFEKERKKIYKNKDKLQSNEQEQDKNVISYKEGMTVQELASALEVNMAEIIKKLMGLGIMASLNHVLDYDTVEMIVVDYNKTLKTEESLDIYNFESYEINDNEENLVERAPIVTIMGHVDHGKTTLLDVIRKSNVTEGEAGGITQAIDAYSVMCHDKRITFIDTPGHAAFTEMRARGASVTDIVIIIVAADDGIMPQTKEAIDHAKAAEVPILVVINKIDKETANIERVMSGLSENGLTPEEWGGDTIVNKISALTGEGLPALLENILLVAEMQEYKANPKRYATGTVIEAKMDKQVGSIATVLVQNGTLRVGDPVVVGTSYGKVRTIKNDLGHDIVEAEPSTPVEITGLTELPSAGDKFMAFETEKKAKQITSERKTRAREQDTNFSGMSLDDLFSQIQHGMKEIKVVLKADVNGSLEAVKSSLEKIDIDGVRIKVIRGGVGAITEGDVVLAQASNALVLGFNVRANAKTAEMAKEYNVDIKTYDIIYKMVEEMEDSMKGMLDPEYEEKVIGNLEIRQMFKFSKVGQIAGCHVTSGMVRSNSLARLVRDGVVVYSGKISTLQHEKDQVKEARKGNDCGVTLENCQDYKELDIIEIYELVEVKK